MKIETLNQLLDDRATKTPVVLAINLNSGEEYLIYSSTLGKISKANKALYAKAREALVKDRSQIIETEEGNIFLNVFNTPLRIIIIGAVHIAQPLAHMAKITGYDVTIIDPRGAFSSEYRFPDITLINEWPDDAVMRLEPDTRTAIVTLTHDPKLDDPALEAALTSSAFFIGCLGSKKTHAARVKRLIELGHSEDRIKFINGPVGLDIGAISPAEIAVSILAQITQSLRQR